MAAARPSQAAALRADTRKMVLDLVERGCRVKVSPDGTLDIEPPAPVLRGETLTLDLKDWSR